MIHGGRSTIQSSKMFSVAVNQCVSACKWQLQIRRGIGSSVSTLTNMPVDSEKRQSRREVKRANKEPILVPESSEMKLGLRPVDTRGQPVPHPSLPFSRRAPLQKDVLMERIMSTGGLDDILAVLDKHLEVMNDFQVGMCVRRMRDFLRPVPYHEMSRTVSSIVTHNAFRPICDRLHDRAYLMGGDAVVVILDFLRFCNVSMRTRVARIYLSMLRQHIQSMDLNELFMAHALLEKLPRIAVVDAMLSALPIACELRYDSELDPDYLPGLLHAVHHFGRVGMSEAAKTKLSNSLIYHTPHFTVDTATTVLRYARGLPADDRRIIRFCAEMIETSGFPRENLVNIRKMRFILWNLGNRGMLTSRMLQRVLEFGQRLTSPLDHLKLAVCIGEQKVFDFAMLDRAADDVVNDLSLIETRWVSQEQATVIQLFASAAYKPKNGSTMLDLLIGSSLAASFRPDSVFADDAQLLTTVHNCLVLRHWPGGLVKRLFSEPFFSALCSYHFPVNKTSQQDVEGGKLMFALRSVVHITDTVYPQHASVIPQQARNLLRECTDLMRAYRNRSVENNLNDLGKPEAVLRGIVDDYGCCFDYGIVVDANSKACIDIKERVRQKSRKIAGDGGPSELRNSLTNDVMYELNDLQSQLESQEKLVLIRVLPSTLYCVSHESRLLGAYLAQNQSLKLRGLAVVNIHTDKWECLSPQEQRLYMRKLVNDVVDNGSLLDPYTVETSAEDDDDNTDRRFF